MSSTELVGFDHPILGRMEPDKKLPGVLVAFIDFGCAQLEISVSPDGGSLDDALKLAESLVPGLAELDARCRQLIAAKLLPEYNTEWRFGQVAKPDNSMEDFEKPSLSETDFAANLTPVSLDVVGDTIELWYSDGDMFWGHSVGLISFDGPALTDVGVQMFG